MGENTILRFNKALQNYLKVSFGDIVYDFRKYNKQQLIDSTKNKLGNSGGYLLPLWNVECNDRNNNGNMTIFVRATKTITPTGNSGATSLPPIGQ